MRDYVVSFFVIGYVVVTTIWFCAMYEDFRKTSMMQPARRTAKARGAIAAPLWPLWCLAYAAGYVYAAKPWRRAQELFRAAAGKETPSV